METQDSKIFGTQKSSSKREFYSDTGLFQDTRKNLKLSLHLKEWEKEQSSFY